MSVQITPVFSSAYSGEFQRLVYSDGPGTVGGADLLPDNATPLERELARLSSYLDQIDPSAVETVWDAWRCPAPVLPWLAWALSVDFWDEQWSEIAKRQAIADAPEYHRRKGTVWAVLRMLALAGRDVEMTEWFDMVPPGRRGTVSVHIHAGLSEIREIIAHIRPLIHAAKPKSRAVAFGVGEKAGAEAALAGVILVEKLITVEPYAFGVQNPETDVRIAAALLIDKLIMIEAH